MQRGSYVNRIREDQMGSRNAPFFYVLNTYMKDKKAAKLIIKRAKKNPFLYSSADIYYAKKVKKLKDDALPHQETQSS